MFTTDSGTTASGIFAPSTICAAMCRGNLANASMWQGVPCHNLENILLLEARAVLPTAAPPCGRSTHQAVYSSCLLASRPASGPSPPAEGRSVINMRARKFRNLLQTELRSASSSSHSTTQCCLYGNSSGQRKSHFYMRRGTCGSHIKHASTDPMMVLSKIGSFVHVTDAS